MQTIKVWDLPLRIFHWLLVVAFFLAYATEEDLLTVHVWAGYLVIGLLLFRLIWGFYGNKYARFNQFLCMPASSIAYLKAALARKSQRFIGHNPAGAAMIILLLVSIFATTLTGLLVYAADQNAGLFAGMIVGNSKELWEEAHEFFANFTMLLVVIHIAGVVFESVLHKENLARSMVSGEKRSESGDKN